MQRGWGETLIGIPGSEMHVQLSCRVRGDGSRPIRGERGKTSARDVVCIPWRNRQDARQKQSQERKRRVKLRWRIIRKGLSVNAFSRGEEEKVA